MDFQSGLSQAWTSIATFVPKLIAFLVILLIGWIIAKLLSKGLDMLLRKIGMEKAAEKSGLSGLFENSKYDTTRLISRIVFFALLLITLNTAFAVFGNNPISDLLASVVAWLPRALVAIVIIVVAAAIANIVKDIIASALSSVSSGRLLATIAWAFIIGLGVIAAVNQIGVARFVTNAVLVAVLASIVGIAIVGLGGGLIRPMQDRWRGWLGRIEDESKQASVPRARQEGEGQAEAPTTQVPHQTGTAPPA